MLLFEHDAKELLAVQGVPVPGGIRLEQVPAADETASEPSGPWLVKPQVLGGLPDPDDHVIAAKSNAEVSAAAARLLGSTISGQTIHSVWVERQFTPVGQTALRLACDFARGGIRIAVGPGLPETDSVFRPDPAAVIEGMKQVAAGLPSGARECVEDAGTMLTPLFFGYEATLMEVDPLFLLPDNSWVIGDARLALDEQALFRHPELLSLVERRTHAYGDVRLRRRRGLAHHIFDDAGTVAVLANGSGLCSFIADELLARDVPLHSITTADAIAFDSESDNLDYLLDWLADASDIRCLLIAVTGDGVDLPGCGKALARAVTHARTNRPGAMPTIVVRLLGAAAGTAGAGLQQAHPALHLEPMLAAAFDHIAERTVEPPA